MHGCRPAKYLQCSATSHLLMTFPRQLDRASPRETASYPFRFPPEWFLVKDEPTPVAMSPARLEEAGVQGSGGR
jgi:hypothetical protein